MQNLYDMIDACARWGDTIRATGDALTAHADNGSVGCRVQFPTGVSGSPEPVDYPTTTIRKVVKFFGRDATAKWRKASVVITAPGKGQRTIRGASPASHLPDHPTDNWAPLSAGAAAVLRQAASIVKESVGGGMNYALDSVHLAPAYAAVSDGLAAAIVWEGIGGGESITVPAGPVKHLPDGAEISHDASRCYFRSGPVVCWTPRVAAPWPVTLVDDMVPARRSLAGAHAVTLPEGWRTALKGATLSPHEAGNPAVLRFRGGQFSLTIPRVFDCDIPCTGATADREVGVDAHLLARFAALVPDNEDAYLSLAGATDQILLFTSPVNGVPVEILVSPHYLPGR